ncbi:DUF5681 domain-containing protein [Methylocaldum sp. MU1018]
MPRGGKTRFQPGQSGNPRGRPPGRPDRRNLFHWIDETDREAVFAKCLELAKDGDPACMRLVIERIAPIRKSQLAPIELPDGYESMTPLGQIEAIDKQVADGAISPDVGAILVGMIKDRLAVIEHGDMLKRLEAMEALLGAIDEAARNG